MSQPEQKSGNLTGNTVITGLLLKTEIASIPFKGSQFPSNGGEKECANSTSDCGR
jgi:hypothetical protein